MLSISGCEELLTYGKFRYMLMVYSCLSYLHYLYRKNSVKIENETEFFLPMEEVTLSEQERQAVDWCGYRDCSDDITSHHQT